MSSFASFEVDPVPLGRGSTSVGVYRYWPGQFPPYELLTNIRVLSVEYREGPHPGIARFRYVFATDNPSSAPQHFEDALSVDSDLPGVVQNDDRLVVLAFNPDGSPLVLFDGFAQVPELRLAPSQELVTFVALGVAVRAWDTPVGGALMRNADQPTTIADVETSLVTHFNAEGLPNATPEGADAQDRFGNQYPTFLDPLVIRSPDVRRYWTLPMAARYLCYHCNADQKYVQNPDGALLDVILDSRAPSSGVLFSPEDPASYESEPIVVPDFPATGKAWPVALYELLRPNGFGMAFGLCTDLGGNPYTSLEIFRLQDGDSSTYKDLYLQAYGATLDPAQTNLSRAHLARDFADIANAYVVESSLVRYEASFILAPGFVITPTDAGSATAIHTFDRSNPSFAQNHDTYRLYIFDETGEGHWDFTKSAIAQSVPSLDALFEGDPENPSPYVRRRRVPLGELLSLDPNLKPLKPQLSISTDYAGVQPGLWDGTGTWQAVSGGFELLRDRLGVWINIQNPNGWYIGSSSDSGAPYPSGIVKGVEDQANSSSKHFILRLTCVIESDQTLSAKADKRPSSPTSYTITRRVDARDRYAKWIKGANSIFNPIDEPISVRDDGPAAQDDANARRLAGEAGEVTGTVTMHRFTAAYRIADKVRSIQGRGLSLRTNAGAPDEEGEVFPAVVGLTWNFDGKQQTILRLSDRRGLL